MGTQEQTADEVARRRREKLQTLRERRQQEGVRAVEGGDEEQDGRQRKRLRALFERRQQGQTKGPSFGSAGPLRDFGKDGARGEFPRLKALLGQRRQGGKSSPDVDASSSAEEVAESLRRLKNRASRLTEALKNTLAEMDRIKKLQAEGHGDEVADAGQWDAGNIRDTQ